MSTASHLYIYTLNIFSIYIIVYKCIYIYIYNIVFKVVYIYIYIYIYMFTYCVAQLSSIDIRIYTQNQYDMV